MKLRAPGISSELMQSVYTASPSMFITNFFGEDISILSVLICFIYWLSSLYFSLGVFAQKP